MGEAHAAGSAAARLSATPSPASTASPARLESRSRMWVAFLRPRGASTPRLRGHPTATPEVLTLLGTVRQRRGNGARSTTRSRPSTETRRMSRRVRRGSAASRSTRRGGRRRGSGRFCIAGHDRRAGPCVDNRGASGPDEAQRVPGPSNGHAEEPGSAEAEGLRVSLSGAAQRAFGSRRAAAVPPGRVMGPPLRAASREWAACWRVGVAERRPSPVREVHMLGSQ